MRAYLSAGLLVCVNVACGNAESSGSGAGGSGQAAGASSGGVNTSSGGVAVSSGGVGMSSGGAASGGAASASGGTATGGAAAASGGVASGGVSGTSGGAAAGLVDCDPRKILCKRAAPVCEQGSVPSVLESCYGDCVRIDQCACDVAAACPNPNEYTCYLSARHCGYYL